MFRYLPGRRDEPYFGAEDLEDVLFPAGAGMNRIMTNTTFCRAVPRRPPTRTATVPRTGDEPTPSNSPASTGLFPAGAGMNRRQSRIPCRMMDR